ncbi:MAG: PAS domain-containing protein, partial [Candidatus Cybelea sp.]
MTPPEWSLIGLVAGLAVGFAIAQVRAVRQKPSPASDPPPQAATTSAEPSVEAIFAPLVRALPMGVIIVDGACHVEFANAAAGTTFGFDPARAIALHIIEAVPNVELERRIGEAMRGEASVAPLLLTRARGQRTYRVSVYPLNDDDGNSRRVVIFFDDQTSLARLDRARKEFLSNV